ncbi:amidase family protein [Citricoccus sp. GCM10030269]|uniref:amidase family protein n=1 Tax=Citricoccus sp. GCM10030269 TaxID=3273388 RepID=UPI0036096564
MNPESLTIQEPSAGVWTEIASEQQILAQTSTPVPPDQRAGSPSGDTSADGAFAVAVKANIAVAGFTRSAGCEALAVRPESTDAPVITPLRAAGAVVVGTTNMHELAFGITSNNVSYGQVPLPGHESRSAGGSSGGSAAAVAEGSVAIALGTDTGGSVSVPASHCGVFGFRPTTGRWPSAGLVGLSWTRDTPGVLTRTLDDAVRADTWITGETGGQNTGGRRRLGLPRQFVDDLDPHTAAVFDRSVVALRERVEVVDVDLAEVLALTGPAEMPTVLWEAKQLLGAVAAEVLDTTPTEGFERLAHQVTSPDVGAILQGECQSPVTAAAYSAAQQATVRARADYAALMEDQRLDALVFPTVPAPAPPLDTLDTVQHRGQTENAFLLHTRHTGQGTMLAAPMVTIPLPVMPDALPVGLTVQGQRWEDRKTLKVADEVHAAVSARA